MSKMKSCYCKAFWYIPCLAVGQENLYILYVIMIKFLACKVIFVLCRAVPSIAEKGEGPQRN